MIEIEIDKSSGFCFGVINAIRRAEKQLQDGTSLKCLGDIVHNSEEVSRLNDKGLSTINYDQLKNMSNTKVLFRAHGEPPEVYEFARKNKIQVIDATCPVVLKLQRKIKQQYEASREEKAQIVIFGKQGHAEVNGLVGQTKGEAIVIQSIEEVEKLDMNRPIIIFSQTTMAREKYQQLIEYIDEHISEDAYFEHFDTICGQVSNRVPKIVEFAGQKDWVYFVAGRKSSNGKVLFQQCLNANKNTIFISSAAELTEALPPWVKTVGICGATSTPLWQMEEVANKIKELNNCETNIY